MLLNVVVGLLIWFCSSGYPMGRYPAIFGSFLFDPIKLDFDVNITDTGSTKNPNGQSTHNLVLRTLKAKNSTVNKTQPWRKIFKSNEPVVFVRSATEGVDSVVKTTEVTIPDVITPDETIADVTTNLPVTDESTNALEKPLRPLKVLKPVINYGTPMLPKTTDNRKKDQLKIVLKDQNGDKNLLKEDQKDDFKKINSELVGQLAVFRSRTEDYSDDREVNTISDLPV